MLLPYLQTVLFMLHLAKFTGCYSTSCITVQVASLNGLKGRKALISCYVVEEQLTDTYKVNTGSDKVEEIRLRPKFDEHLQLNAFRQKDKFCPVMKYKQEVLS